MQAQHSEFLATLGAHETRHSGRSFYEHLKGVHDLLRDWGNDETVCLAGLYHSIYGNAFFRHQSLSDRSMLERMIGAHAELLVHTFCTAQRPLFENVHDNEMRSQLIEIEAANILEQGGGRATLRKLLRQKLSAGARAALLMELARDHAR